MQIADILDLDQFPIDQPGAERSALVARCKADLAREGMFNLVGFMKPQAITGIVETVKPRMAEASFTHAREHNIYFLPQIDGLPPDHPALSRKTTINHTLCADQLMDTGLAALYEYPPFAAFLAEVMEMPALHQMEDTLSAFNVMGYGAGEALNWHFDRSHFTTTLLLQAPEAGGAFEYRSGLRSDDDPNYDGVGRLLTGGDDQVRQLDQSPGTLNVFRGKNTAHRVTPVEGARQRLIAVFSYYDRPGVAFSDAEKMGFYGRTG